MKKCKHCGDPVDLDAEGATYPDGTCAHDHCHDAHAYHTANESDFRD